MKMSTKSLKKTTSKGLVDIWYLLHKCNRARREHVASNILFHFIFAESSPFARITRCLVAREIAV